MMVVVCGVVCGAAGVDDELGVLVGLLSSSSFVSSTGSMVSAASAAAVS